MAQILSSARARSTPTYCAHGFSPVTFTADDCAVAQKIYAACRKIRAGFALGSGTAINPSAFRICRAAPVSAGNRADI
jgi:hypothetical protein